MGQLSLKASRVCCHVETLPRPKWTVASAPVAGATPGPQDIAEYHERYEDLQPTVPGGSMVFDVRSVEKLELYVCRHLPKHEIVQEVKTTLIERHIRALCALSHPHLCQAVECFDDLEAYYLVSEKGHSPAFLEFVEGHDGVGGLGELNDRQIAEAIRQILSGLAHGHQRGLVHGRLTPENLLLSAPDGDCKKDSDGKKIRGMPQIKVADFGLGYVLRPPLGKMPPKLEEDDASEAGTGELKPVASTGPKKKGAPKAVARRSSQSSKVSQSSRKPSQTDSKQASKSESFAEPKKEAKKKAKVAIMASDDDWGEDLSNTQGTSKSFDVSHSPDGTDTASKSFDASASGIDKSEAEAFDNTFEEGGEEEPLEGDDVVSEGEHNDKHQHLPFVSPECAWLAVGDVAAAGTGGAPVDEAALAVFQTPPGAIVVHGGKLSSRPAEEPLKLEAWAKAGKPVIAASITDAGIAPPGAERTDVWSVGIIAYRLFTGELPFMAETDGELLSQIRGNAVLFDQDIWKEVPQEAKKTLEKMLKINARFRPTAIELLKCDWLTMEREPVSKARLNQLFKNMVRNTWQGQFRKLVYRIIVAQLKSSDLHLDEVQRAMRMLDLDRDGVISLKEFMAGLRQFPEFDYLEDPESLFDSADRDRSGSLDFNEFAAATLPQRWSRGEQNLFRAFRAFDVDSEGAISLAEIENTAKRLEGAFLAPMQLDEYIEALRLEFVGLDVSNSNTGSVEGDSRMAVLLERAKEKIFFQRRLDFGEFVYLCNMTPKDNRWQQSAKKEVYRCVDIACDIDLYDIRAKSEILQWPQGEGAVPRTPRCMYRYGGDLVTGKVDSPRTRKKKNADRWKRHKRENFGPKNRQKGKTLQAEEADGDQADPEPLY